MRKTKTQNCPHIYEEKEPMEEAGDNLLIYFELMYWSQGDKGTWKCLNTYLLPFCLSRKFQTEVQKGAFLQHPRVSGNFGSGLGWILQLQVRLLQGIMAMDSNRHFSRMGDKMQVVSKGFDIEASLISLFCGCASTQTCLVWPKNTGLEEAQDCFSCWTLFGLSSLM